MTDLFLRYTFTDRAGRKVYDAFSASDRLKMQDKLFEIRIDLGSADDKHVLTSAEITWLKGVEIDHDEVGNEFRPVNSHGTG